MRDPLVLTLSILTVMLALVTGGPVASAAEVGKESQGPVQTSGTQPASSPFPVEDPIVSYEKRMSVLEEWKGKIERLPSLNNKFNVGLNALQFLYTHQDAHVAEGKSQDNLSIRRSELLFYGKINEYIPKWHALSEFQSTALTNATPGCKVGTDCSSAATNPPGTAAAATYFRESYIDFRPIPAIAPQLNMIRMGIFRMPFGIFTETSGGIRDVISSPFLTSVGSGGLSKNSTGGTIEFLQERDFFVDMRGTLFNKLEYVAGVMNGNNFQANSSSVGANAPKVFYTRERFLLTDISWVSFNVLTGESNNTNTAINGRGKGEWDRWGVDARYTSRLIPGLMVQAEWWQGHDGANQTLVGTPAQGACQVTTICGGSGAPGVQRRTWYALAKYFISDGPLKNYEPVVMYDEFDPNTAVSNDMFKRWIVGFNYYFENLPPKIQTKLSIDYEFRHHQGTGPGTSVANTDAFAQNAFFMQFQVRYQ